MGEKNQKIKDQIKSLDVASRLDRLDAKRSAVLAANSLGFFL